MGLNRFHILNSAACIVAWCGLASLAPAIDFESFEFNDANGTQLDSAVNSNTGNNWFVDADMAPSQVQTISPRPGSYYIIKESTAADNNFLQIADIMSGTRYLTAKLSGWSFLEAPEEIFRLAFLNGDTEPGFSNLITAQMSLVRINDTEVELTGFALGTSAASIPNTITLPADHSGAFEMTLELNKTANKFKVFYRDGSNPSQVLGSGLIDPTREGRALRMQATGNFGDFNDFFPGEVLDFLAIDRIALTDTNPHTDLVTLEIDRDDGAMTLRNSSGATISGIESYSITSAVAGLNPAGWMPIAGGADSASNEELMQTFGGGGISLSNGEEISLSMGDGAWLKSPFEDVDMVLNLTGGVTRTVNVNFVDNGGLRFMLGDFTFDNAITVADYLELIAHAETDLMTTSIAEAYQNGDLDRDLANSISDFAAFKSIYEAANGGAGSFAVMLASIPEPSTAILLGMGLVLVPVARRNRRIAIDGRGKLSAIRSKSHTSTPELGSNMMRRSAQLLARVFFFAAVLLAAASHVSAGILEDFMFEEPDGTLLGDTENSANPGNSWTVDEQDTVESEVFDGSFRIQKQSMNLQASNYIDIVNITDSKAWLVAEIAGWNYTATPSSPSEEVRFSFLNNDNMPPSGSTITAQMRIVRSATALELAGTGALGTGAMDIGPTYALPLVQTDPFTMVLELDKTVDQYTVYYKDGSDPFQILGFAPNAPSRDGNSIRFAFTGLFGDTGEFFDVDRIYLTDENPITDPVDPVALSLIVNTSTRDITIKNETDDPISFDSYRISSDSDSLDFGNWDSLNDRMPPLDPFEGGDDPGETWDEAAGADDGVLAESFLLSFSTLNPDDALSLGQSFKMGGMEDLLFQYHDSMSGAIVSVEPTYITMVGVPGDYNSNGVVDAADYTVYRDTLGSTTDLRADGTGPGGVPDGVVDQLDYQFWVDNFGNTSGGGSLSGATVPEPASALLVLMVWVAAGLRVRPPRIAPIGV